MQFFTSSRALARVLSGFFMLSLLAGTALQAQTSSNVAFQGNLDYTQELSDVWGWTNPADNREYAIVGLFDGVSIVDVTDPTTPVELHFVPGAGSIWRDMKTWGNYAYITNESSGGLLIIDMSALPVSISTSSWSGGVGFSSAHNIFMDENGVAYLCGSNGSLGTLMIDCDANPTNPPILGSYTTRYVHDLFVRGDTMWTAEINNGIFSVIDVSNKAAPVILASQSTSSNFSHNCWLSDDGATLFTTDEVSGANVDAYDVSDLTDIQQLDLFRPNAPGGSIPHNTIVRGNFLLTAWYRDGLRITDATQPDNMIEVGFYDTSPLSGSGFNGAWGVYPYLASGNVLISDIESGLYVLTPNYTGAAFLSGQITDAGSGAPLFNATVSISGTSASDQSDLFGQYATGLVAGTYTVTVALSGYITQTFTSVALAATSTTILNVALAASTPFTLTGQVQDAVSGTGIAGAQVRLLSLTDDFTATADGAGNYTFVGIPGNSYDVIAGGQWGYITTGLIGTTLGTGSSPLNIGLNAGFYDDFNFDLGWTVSGNATTGIWEIGEPIGTGINPDVDAPGDLGDQAYVTGNGGGSVGFDDVDGGNTLLTSPVFDLSASVDPSVSYTRWWDNSPGSAVNDSLVIRLSNGSTTAVLEVLVDGDPSEGAWTAQTFRVLDFLTPTANMQLTVETADRPSTGDLVEAGLDAFRVTDTGPAVCSPPTNPLATNLTPTSVRLVWDAVPGATGYQVQGRPVGVGSFRSLVGTDNFRDINILSPGNTYEWKVRVRCADASISAFTALNTFTTPTLRAQMATSIAPNPAREQATMRFQAPNAGLGQWMLMDMDGRVHTQGKILLTGDAQQLAIPVASLAAGMYQVVLQGTGWKDQVALQRIP